MLDNYTTYRFEMLDSMVRKRHNRASHCGVVTIRVEEANTVMEGKGTPNRGGADKVYCHYSREAFSLSKIG